MAQTTSGTQIFISNTLPATQDETGYAALTWIEVGEVTDIAEFGRTYEEIITNYLNQRRVAKHKGNYDEGSPAITVTRNTEDGGQQACQTALASDDNSAFKILHQNADVDYFEAKVLSYTQEIGAANKTYNASIQLSIDSDIVPVNAV